MNQLFIRFSLVLALLPAIALANPYDVSYFLKNPDDIGEQLDICRISVWKAKASGNLGDVKAAKNNPACIAAEKAKQQIKNEKEAKAEQDYALRKKARANMKAEVAKQCGVSTCRARVSS